MADDNLLFAEELVEEDEQVEETAVATETGAEKPAQQGTVALPSDSILRDTAYMFKMMGDLTRVKILSALSIRELCVQDIADTVKISQSAISHQLRLLRTGKLVKYRKVGKQVYYSIENQLVKDFLNEAQK